MTDTGPARILLTGATGFIGGTVLNQLLKSNHPSLATKVITILVRDASRAVTLVNAFGGRVEPIVYEGLDDIETTQDIASKHDIVISMTLGFHATSGQALLRGLAQRKAATKRDVYMIHLSGASDLAHQPITGAYLEDSELDDIADDVYAYERMRENLRPYHQRTTELGVIDKGLELGVKTLVMMPPLIFRKGTGLFNKSSVQIPVYVEAALHYGKGVVIEEGKGQIDHVHVEDLAALYEIVLMEILENGGKRLPQRRKGIMFAANGRHTWMEVARQVANTLFNDASVEGLDLAEASEAFKSYADLVGGDLTELEPELCSNSRTVSSVAKTLGWKPTRNGDEWLQGFREDVDAVLQRRK